MEKTENYDIFNLSVEDMKTILWDNFRTNVDLDDITREHAEKTFLVVAYQEIVSDDKPEFYKQIVELSTNNNNDTNDE